MHTFEFIRPADAAAAIAAAAQAKTAQQGADVRFIAGGTTLIDLMKLNVETPARLLDINRLPLDKIEATPDGGLKIGATVRNSDLAQPPDGAARLCRAVAGDPRRALRRSSATWRRRPATCSSARAACTSATPRCPATSASPAPAARRSPAATARSPSSARANIASRPTRRTCAWRWRRWRRRSTCRGRRVRARSRSATFIFCPATRRTAKRCSSRATSSRTSRCRRPIAGSKQVYLKLRDRASYEFALASAAVVLTVAGGNVTRARIALGGVGTKPWRSPEAEAALVGQACQRSELPQGGGSGAARRQAAERERVQDRAGQALPRRTPCKLAATG